MDINIYIFILCYNLCFVLNVYEIENGSLGHFLSIIKGRMVSPVRGKVRVHAVQTANGQSSQITTRTIGGMDITGTAD